MSFTRDWAETTPIDHTQFKEAPTYIRYSKVDISDRLKDILSGFTSGETLVGIKLGKFLTIGTAANSAPSGTGTAADVNVYARQTTAGTYADLYIRNTTGNELRLTILDKLCLDNARLSNNTWFIGTDTGGVDVNIFKVNTGSQIQFSGHIYVADTAPTADLQLAPKGYVDAQNTSQSISEAQIVASSISQGKLKTSSGEVNASATTGSRLVLPGGGYGFYPQVKQPAGGANAQVSILTYNAGSGYTTANTSYETSIIIRSQSGQPVYAQQRYVSSSGHDHWIFLLIEKSTQKVIASYQAPDHPSANTELTELEIPHPFGSYNPDLHEIILADNDALIEAKRKINRRRSLLTVLSEDFMIDDTKRPTYEAREIIRINEFPDDPIGKIIKNIRTPRWAKIVIQSDEISLEQRIIEKLPDNILYKKLWIKH